MPIFIFTCRKCSEPRRKLLPNLEKAPFFCPQCGHELVREGLGPTSRIVEIRDDGIRPKKVEQLANIQELIRNRE